MTKTILVTGVAGFIGYHVADRLLAAGWNVVGIDNLNSYYDVQLKRDRLSRLEGRSGFRFAEVDIADRQGVEKVFAATSFDRVIHLAAQAGVRYSIANPHAYVEGNVSGFLNILEGCRHNAVQHLVFASSSSVYGANRKIPFSERDNVDHPVSLYAATKKANELMAHTYAHLYGLAVTGLRFFTVYGPWGRPDMAYFSFAKNILAGKPIQIFNEGRMRRDFTYVDDIVEGVLRAADRPAQPNLEWSGTEPDPGSSYAKYRIFNIGNNQPVELLRFVEVLEEALGVKAKKEFLPMQAGDVPETFADVDRLASALEWRPRTSLEDGLSRFVDWYREYYRV